MKNDEIVVSQMKAGINSRQSIGFWVVDQDLCLKFADERTEWITPESVGRVLDEAVRITARLWWMLNREAPTSAAFLRRLHNSPLRSSTETPRLEADRLAIPLEELSPQ